MAKMIKCPTCGTQIEVQSADGQVIRCPGCGKGLKLVAKKPPGAAPAPARDAGSSQGSMAAMTFHGELPPRDDMPSLDANCDVCGRPTDPDKLIEDNGRMICPDCEKGARSRIDRPVGGAAPLEFKPAVPAPMKRGRVINLTPAFFAACLAGLVWAGAHTYLTLVEKPQGTGPGLAKANVPGDAQPPTVSPPAPETDPATVPPPSASDTPSPVEPRPQDPQENVVAADPPPSTTPPETSTTQPLEVAVNPAPPEPPATQGSILFPQDELPPLDSAPATPEPEPMVVAGDSIDRGLALLREQKYTAALREFDDARRKHLVGAGTGELTPEQAVTLNGLAAAYLGSGRADQLEIAEGLLNTAVKRGDHSRALAMNRAIVAMRRNPTFQKLGVAANDLKAYLDSEAGDEYAAKIFGTLLNRAASMPNAPKDKIEPFWEYLDKYTDEIARTRGETDKLMWGIEWLPAEDVMRFRQARTAGSGISVTEAAKQLEAARARLKSAQAALDKAQLNGGDIIGAQKSVEANTQALQEAEKALQAAAATMTPPKWLEKFEPVVPVRE